MDNYDKEKEKVYWSINNQIWGRISDQLDCQTRTRIEGLSARLAWHINRQVEDQVWRQVDSQVWNQVLNQVEGQV